MENHNFNGKTHYKWPFSIAMLNYQRVSVVFGYWVSSRMSEQNRGQNLIEARDRQGTGRGPGHQVMARSQKRS
jgi:hypothetical protein